MDTLQLKSFVAIAEAGTFGQAADIVHRTQSVLSMQIRKLEAQLGCALFDRTGRRVVLTPQGEVFLSYSRRILQLQREAYSRLHEPEVEGEIRFAAPEDFATQYLSSALSSFHQQHPRVRLNVACDMTMNLLDQFYRGEYDVILVKRDPQNVTCGTNVWSEPLVWVASEEFQPEGELSLVLAPLPCVYRARALSALDRVRRGWHISYASPSLAGTLAAVNAGLGVTVLPARFPPVSAPSAHAFVCRRSPTPNWRC